MKNYRYIPLPLDEQEKVYKNEKLACDYNYRWFNLELINAPKDYEDACHSYNEEVIDPKPHLEQIWPYAKPWNKSAIEENDERIFDIESLGMLIYLRKHFSVEGLWIHLYMISLNVE